MEEEKKRQREEKERKKQEWQKEHNYSSLKIKEEEEEEEEEEREEREIQYLIGDVTQPQNTSTNDAIIVHCVDDSGQWGHGGLFSSI
uniref:Uncharacterized protein n=1 Tax=Amphimedon queenslandica TaxID=400682 RepID=A0A1X7T7R2_AMPQE